MRFGTQTFLRAVMYLWWSSIRPFGHIDHRFFMRLYIPYLRSRGVVVRGAPLYVSPTATLDLGTPGLLELGDRCVISSGARILVHDFAVDRFMEATDETRGGINRPEYKVTNQVKIGSRAFIGAGAILLPGAEIGDGAVVGAGAVVRGEVPAGAIFIGNPAYQISSVEEWGPKAIVRAVKH